MLEQYDLAIVGAGPVAYASVTQIREIKPDLSICIIYSDVANSRDATRINLEQYKRASPKLRQKKVIESLTSYLETNEIDSQSNFKYVGLNGMGGSAAYWGASIAQFDKNTLNRNHFSKDLYDRSKKIILKNIYISGCVDDDLSPYYKGFHKCEPVSVSNRLQKFNSISNQVIMGAPRVAVNLDLCKQCGNCLNGCSYGAIWYPDMKMFKQLDVHAIHADVAFTDKKNGLFDIYNSLNEIIVKAKKVILASGVLSNFKLMSQYSLTKRAKIYHTPALAFGFASMYTGNKMTFGMAQKTFSILSKNNDTISFGNLFEGCTLDHASHQVYSKNSAIDFFLRKIGRHLIPGIAFLRSDTSEVSVTKKENSMLINQNFTAQYKKDVSLTKKLLRTVGLHNNAPMIAFKKVMPGLDIHYAGGVPDDLEVNPETGRLLNVENLYVAGGSCFSNLPAESPTFSFMVSGASVGKSVIQDL